MPEMPDVVAGNTITVAWGNQIRDRTVQRYATVAARNAAEPAPADGRIAVTTDTGTLWIAEAGSWVQLAAVPITAAMLGTGAVTTVKLLDEAVTAAKIQTATITATQLAVGSVQPAKLAGNVTDAFELEDFVNVATSAIGTSPGVEATITFTIPAAWASWRCTVTATGFYVVPTGTVTYRVRIDGTDQLAHTSNYTPAGNNFPFAVVGHRAGMSTTGSRAVDLVVNTSTGSGTVTDVTMVARALRTG